MGLPHLYTISGEDNATACGGLVRQTAVIIISLVAAFSISAIIEWRHHQHHDVGIGEQGTLPPDLCALISRAVPNANISLHSMAVRRYCSACGWLLLAAVAAPMRLVIISARSVRLTFLIRLQDCKDKGVELPSSLAVSYLSKSFSTCRITGISKPVSASYSKFASMKRYAIGTHKHSHHSS